MKIEGPHEFAITARFFSSMQNLGLYDPYDNMTFYYHMVHFIAERRKHGYH